ncbi:hypothetical protein D041_3947B, partial [Vibrio parahaemolyticus EKP-008]
TNGHIR